MPTNRATPADTDQHDGVSRSPGSAGGGDRYHRQTLLECFGPGSAERLGRTHAVIVGLGALGCSVADGLARAGVGRLTLIDRDVVESTNLQRQVLFDERDVAEQMPKAEAAARRLAAVNSGVRTGAVVADLVPANAQGLILGEPASPPNLVVDGTDNFHARLVLNDLCIKHAVPLVYAGVVSYRGTVMAVVPGSGGPCLRCVVREIPSPEATPTCDTVGVFGPAVGVVTALQARLALGLLLGVGSGASAPEPDSGGGLTEVDLGLRSAEPRVRTVRVRRDPACPCCGGGVFDFLEGRRGSGSAEICGADAVQIAAGGGVSRGAPARLDLSALGERLAAHGSFVTTRFLVRGTLRDVSANGAAVGLTVFRDGRAVVTGTTDTVLARSVYARYVGG